MKKSDIQVLIVDDDVSIGKTLSEAITRAGFRSTVCTRADEALSQVKMKLFQAAVIDCMLPVMNGINFADAIRKTRFGDGAVVLMSGIFRDRSFGEDAIKKTKAIAFLQKPFGSSDLLAVLKPKLDGLIDNQQWTLQTILTKRMDSTRDRVKVVEHLEEIKGVEFAFVLSILADAKVSGSLNLVTEASSIFGLKLSGGLIASIDSDTSDEVVVRYLIDTGYLTKEDWEDFENTEVRRSGPLAKLVQAGKLSPHAARKAQNDQILHDLKKILNAKKVNINFVPDSVESTASEGLNLADAFSDLNDTIDSLLSIEYLKPFFAEKMTSSVHKLTTFNQDNPVWQYPIVKKVKDFAGLMATETTLEQLVSKYGNVDEILKAVYCLVIFRQILFTDPQAMKNFEMETVRRRKLLSDIADKNPYQIFGYFGTSAECKQAEVQEAFREFVKTIHPDRLSPEAPVSLRETTTELFSIVSEAHETLTNPAKLLEYKNKIVSNAAEKEFQSESLQRECLELIRRGSYAKAEEKANEAVALSPSNRALCMQVWAKMKQTSKVHPKDELADFKKKLEAFDLEDRRDPHYHMAQGLLRVALGDINAIQSFEKAVALNPQFVEARREINAIQGKGKEKSTSSATDILTGDITSIVSAIFKRKSK